MSFLMCSLLIGGVEQASAQTYGIAEGRAHGSNGSSSLPLTATEALAHVNHTRVEALNSVSHFRAEHPEDSIRAVVAADARAHLAVLQGRGRTGMQVEAYVELFVAAEQDDSAQALINARVASPELSNMQKAYAYMHAIRLFADYHRPARVAIAEVFLTRLRALGSSTTSRQFQAELALIQANYNLFRYAEVARHGQIIIAMLPSVPYGFRDQIFSVYGMLVDAMTRVSNGRIAVEQMNERLRKALKAPGDSVTMGGWDVGMENGNRDKFQKALVAQERVGHRGGPLFSNYWVNTPDTSAHSMKVDDGKIRLLGFGSWMCGFCVSLGSSMQRIHRAFPGEVEAVFVTETTGSGWGNRVVTPAEQSMKLTDWIVNVLRLNIPIALYRAPMIADPDGADGDMMPDYSGRAQEQRDYPWVGKPTLYLLDGTGTIRRVFAGFSGRQTEAQILAAVQHLRNERTAAVRSATASISTTLPSL